jgi:hypothetical protein
LNTGDARLEGSGRRRRAPLVFFGNGVRAGGRSSALTALWSGGGDEGRGGSEAEDVSGGPNAGGGRGDNDAGSFDAVGRGLASGAARRDEAEGVVRDGKGSDGALLGSRGVAGKVEPKRVVANEGGSP